MFRVPPPVLLLAVLALPAGAGANAAAPWRPGHPVGEPVGAMRRLAIVRETLSIDLTAFASGGSGRVSAVYGVRNDGPPATVELLFVAATATTGASVRLDGAALPFASVDDLVLPPEWRAPAKVPDVGGGENRYEAHAREGRGLRFEATFPHGAHELAVEYPADPGRLADPDGWYEEYLVAYVLAPARSWASFGRLDVTIDLPSGWLAATSLPMSRVGDRLSAAFAGVPADTLGLTVRAPEGNEGLRFWAPWIGAAASLVLALLAGRWAGRRSHLRRRSRGRRIGVAVALWYATLVAAVMLVMIPWILAESGAPRASLSALWFRTMMWHMVGALLAAVVFGTVAFAISHVASHRAARAAGAGTGGGAPAPPSRDFPRRG